MSDEVHLLEWTGCNRTLLFMGLKSVVILKVSRNQIQYCEALFGTIPRAYPSWVWEHSRSLLADKKAKAGARVFETSHLLNSEDFIRCADEKRT